MINFAKYIDLPMVWGGIVFLSIMLYIILDGFDLGVGIIFLLAKNENCRIKMMSSIAPFWDGNETWLVLGGGSLLAAFPLAYSIILPALYMPIMLMLLALVFRGVSFEFYAKSVSNVHKFFWGLTFHFGSLVAAFMQGTILISLVKGLKLQGYNFVGSKFEWFNIYSFIAGIFLILGYALLGSSWIFMKTAGTTQKWAFTIIRYTLIYLLIFISAISMWMLFYINPKILIMIPICIMLIAYFIYNGINNMKDYMPFFATLTMFLLIFISLLIKTWPYIVPYNITFTEASATPQTQSIMLVGTVIILPIVISYSAYNFYVFRGKFQTENTY